jgi:ribosome-associated protein
LALEQEIKDNQDIQPVDFIDTIVDSIQDVKGKKIVKLDLREIDDASVDFFLICEGDSTTHIQGISHGIHKRLKEEYGITPLRQEGKTYSRWILMDYFDVIIHIFYPEVRTFYDLEDLWSDAISTEYEDI